MYIDPYTQVTTGYYRLLNVTKSDYRLEGLLQVILEPFTGGVPSKNTLLSSCLVHVQCFSVELKVELSVTVRHIVMISFVQ